MGLRPYQNNCLSVVKANFEQGIERLLVVLATGCGKTVIASHVPQLFQGNKTLFIAHTEELIKQAAHKMAHWNPVLNVGIEMGSLYAPTNSDIVVSSVQSLGRADGRRLRTLDPSEFGAVIVDEAHRVTGEGYERVLKHFGFTGEGRCGRLLLGITATPNRSDGVGLARVFDKIAFNYDMLSAIRDGWLCGLKGVRVKTAVNLDGIHTSAGDFQQDELARAVNTPSRNRLIVEEWLKSAERRKTIGFTVDIKHGIELAEAFRGAGVNAAAVWGVDPEREVKLRDHRAGKVDVLLNASLLTEGYDDPTVQCILLAAPTKSQLRYIQSVGRGTRIPEDVANLNDALREGLTVSKTDCLVLDFADSTSRHSLATLPSIFGLPKDLDLKGAPILAAFDQIDKVRNERPEIDLSGLDTLDNLQTFVEHVDLFEVKYAPEVEENSKFQWHKAANGDYLLLLPENEKVSISEDLIGQFRIKGRVNGNEFEDTEKDLAAAFGTADNMLRYLGRNLMQYVRREAKKTDNTPATDRQIRAITYHLAKRGQTVPDLSKLTKHKASQLIRKFQAV